MGEIRGEIVGKVTGTVGDVTITTWKGIKVVKRKRGPSAVPPLQAQMQQRNRFLLASTYAKGVGADRQKRALYETLARGQPTTWRALAIQDYLTPSIIIRVDVDKYTGKAGERIDIFVQDATCQRVKVTVLDPTQGGANALGAVVEEGEAQRAVDGQDFHWVLSDDSELSERPIRQTLLPTQRSRRPARQCCHAYYRWGVVRKEG